MFSTRALGGAILGTVLAVSLSGCWAGLTLVPQPPWTGERMAEAFAKGGLPAGVLQTLHLAHAAADEQAQFLKDTFRSGRSRAGKSIGELDRGPFVPPVALPLESPHGAHLLALGRWKWKSQGGYPTLAHGGLSLLEVLCPFVEISAAGA